MAEEINGMSVPLTDAGCHFILSYHLKGVRNSNCGSPHVHRRLLKSDNGLLAVWKVQFCRTLPPLVLEVDKMFLGVTTIISGRQRTRRHRSNQSGATT